MRCISWYTVYHTRWMYNTESQSKYLNYTENLYGHWSIYSDYTAHLYDNWIIYSDYLHCQLILWVCRTVVDILLLR